MLKHLHLSNVGPAAEIEMTFGERLNLITGDNGYDHVAMVEA
jgi:hypothetical protein